MPNGSGAHSPAQSPTSGSRWCSYWKAGAAAGVLDLLLREAQEHARQERSPGQPTGEHVVEDGVPADEVELLEDHPDLGALRPELGALGAGDLLAEDVDRAGRGIGEAVHAAQ